MNGSPIEGILDNEGNLVALRVPIEIVPLSIGGTAEDWERALLPKDCKPIMVKIEGFGECTPKE